MDRPNKIALIGAQGYEQQAPQRIDCFPWPKLSADLNLRDYDTVLLNLLSLSPHNNPDWDLFEHVVDFRIAVQFLQSQGRIIILGDPRFSVPQKGKKGVERSFLSWTGLKFHWDSQSGDTVILKGDYASRPYSGYLGNLRRWDYSLHGCELDLEQYGPAFDISRLQKADIRLVLRKRTLCENRYRNSLAFLVAVAIEEHQRGYDGTDVRTLAESGPIIFLPRIDLDEDQSIITVLRDLCGVESQLPEPSWVSEMLAPGQRAIDTEILEIKTKVGSLQNELAQAEELRSGARACLKLLFERGLPLEKSVREVLRALGANVEDPPEVGKEDGWITVQVAGSTLEGVLEIKSTKNDQFGENGMRQLLDWVNRGIRLRQKGYKGIFIGNSAVTRPVNERPWPFSDSFKKSAEVGHLVALRSTDLFLLYFLDTQGRLNREQFWQQLFDTDGLFDISSYMDLLVPKKKESEP
jgi:hypothetical protein